MASIFKKLTFLLAVLLGSMLSIVVPASAETLPASGLNSHTSVDASDEAPISIVAGELSAGEAEGVLQPHEKTHCNPLAKFLLQFMYPQSLKTEAIPNHHPYHLGSGLLHSILTKGP